MRIGIQANRSYLLIELSLYEIAMIGQVTHQWRTLYPQKETRRETNATMTMPTLFEEI